MNSRIVSILLPTTLAGAVLLSLVDAAAKSFVLLGLAAVTCLALRRASAATRHLIWLSTLGAALAMPVLSFCLPQWRVLPTWLDVARGTRAAETSATTAEVKLVSPTHLETRPLPQLIESPTAVLEPLPQSSSVPAIPPTRPWFELNAFTLLIVWGVGAVVLLVPMARSAWVLKRLSSSLRVVTVGPVATATEQIAKELGLRSPLLYLGSAGAMPMVWGIGRGRILLPAEATAWNAIRLRVVLLHELAHLRRHDPLTQAIAQLARALHWFNPLAWLAVRCLRVEQERACDDYVLRGGVNPSEYAGHVLELATHLQPAPRAASVALAMADRARIEGRLQTILDAARNRRSVSRWLAALTVLLAGSAALSLAMLQAADGKKGDSTADTSGVESGTVPLGAIRSASDPDDPKFAGHFSGRVMGPDGKPLSGARVFIVPVYGANKEPGPVRAKTDDDGRFKFDAPDMTYAELDGLPARREGLLIVTKDGYAPDWFHTWGQTRSGFHSHWDPVKGADVNLQLAKDDVPIHGRFLDPAGGPLVGARVRLTTLLIPKDRDLDAHLDRQQKAGIFSEANYERQLYQLHLIPGLTTETRTDADGRFTLSALGNDRLASLTVSAPSVVDHSLTVMTRDAPDVGTVPLPDRKPSQIIYGAGFTLQLKRGLTINGLVRDRETHAPIRGMWVARRRNPLTDSSFSADAPVTDENGRFTISGLDPELLNWKSSNREISAFPQPGGQFLMASGIVERDADVVIDCPRGIPFRLKVIDEQGKPVLANVEYQYVDPNPHIADLKKTIAGNWTSMNRAARRADGTYEGFVLTGPGAVLVKTPGRSYRPAHVDPKGVFEPGRTDWTPQERISTYGTHNTLAIGGGWVDQHDYPAIVLVNPAPNSGPLELSATVFSDKPRIASLVDPDGQPVVGAMSQGITFHPWDAEPQLRAASFPLTKLHPDRARRITFIKEDRQLIGFLMARGDGETPYTVRMQPWGTVTGQLLDENGEKLSAKPKVSFDLGGFGLETNTDAEVGEYANFKIDSAGRFQVDRLVPGQRYTAKIYRGIGHFAGMAFENLVVRPGEIRDLGGIRTTPPEKRADKRDGPASTPPPASTPSDTNPKHESGQALFKQWQDSARTDGKIPGGALRSLARAVANFIKLNPTNEAVPKLTELLKRIDTSHDWTQADAVALLNDLTDIYPTLPAWAGAGERFSIGGPIRPGEPLPVELSGAAWGQPAANGLHAAWLLEPGTAQHPLGTNLKSRILFHNTGKETVVFRTPDWHQYPNHEARDANGAAIRIWATEWTRLSTLVPIRLAPGEYAEVEAHGIGVGARDKQEENWAGLRVGAWIEAKEGDEVTFQPAAVDANEDRWTMPADRKTPAEQWKAIVRERIDREGPMPTTAADREQLIRRVTPDLIGVPPTQQEIAAFAADNSPDALAALANRLVPRIAPFAGDLPVGEIKFRVTAADPDAAKRPRVATGPNEGWYTLGDYARLSIVQKRDGDRRVNAATILFFSPDPNAEPPGKPHEIKLPDGHRTWAIAWERGSTVLWVAQKGLVRKYDFTNPAQVKETRFEPGSIVDVPEQLRDSLRKVFDLPGTPVQQPESQKPKGGADTAAHSKPAGGSQTRPQPPAASQSPNSCERVASGFE